MIDDKRTAKDITTANRQLRIMGYGNVEVAMNQDHVSYVLPRKEAKASSLDREFIPNNNVRTAFYNLSDGAHGMVHAVHDGATSNNESLREDVKLVELVMTASAAVAAINDHLDNNYIWD